MDLIDSGMVGLPINDFASGIKIPVDLYIRLGENRYILVAKAGTYNQSDRFDVIEGKPIHTLYLVREDYERFVEQTLQIAKSVIHQAELPQRAKLTILSQAVSSVLSEIKDLNLNTVSYDHARVAADLILQFANFDVIDALRSKSLNDPILAVSLLSVTLAQKLGWTKTLTLEKIALGALLIDIAKKDLPAELFTKPRIALTPEEIALYESHPVLGAQLLKAITIVPDDVTAIVLEHHENSLAEGFPRRLKDFRLNPLSRVVALANAFVELVIPRTKTLPKTPTEAVQHLEISLGQPYNREVFTVLKSLITPAKKRAS